MNILWIRKRMTLKSILFCFICVFSFTHSTTAWGSPASVDSVSITSAPSIACNGSEITIFVTYNLGGSGWRYPTKIYSIIGFSNSTNPNSGSAVWAVGNGGAYGDTYNSNCSFATSVTFMANSYATTVVSWTVQTPASGSYSYILVDADTSNPGCGWGVTSDASSITIPCPVTDTPTFTPTNTPIPGATPTKTFTPTPTYTAGSGSTPTKTPVPTNTFTPTKTFTPTVTPSPTKTFTPTVTSTPTICRTPIGATSGTLFGTCTCFNNAVSLLADTSVFGMGLGDLAGLADYSGTETDPVSIVSDWKLTYYSGSVTFDPAQTNALHTLNQEGLLVVDGNLVMDAGANCDWRGVIFCTGNVWIEDSDTVEGAIILGTPYYNGTPSILTLEGSNGNFGTVIYSPTYVTKVQQQVAIYKENLSQRRSFQAVPSW